MKKILTIATLAFVLFISGSLSVSYAKDSDSSLIKTVVSLTGSVFDAVSREPVTVNLVILDENNKKITSTKSNASENGMYYITGLKPGRKYYLSVNQPEYFKEKIEIQIPNTDKYLEISRDLLAKPLKKNAAIPFAIPPFELNKSKLRFGAAEILDDIARTLSYNPNVKIQIVCYPDNNNDKTANKKLSEDRANSIVNYFVAKGIPESYISIKAMDSTDPKNPPPSAKRAKGKRYIGTTYFIVTEY